MDIPFGKPFFTKTEWKNVSKVLKSGWLAHGPVTKEFEEKFSKEVKSKYAVAVNSCTAALHLSLLAVGIKKGDEVIVPAQTHVATAHAVMYTGAKPIFADVELSNYNISINSIQEKITKKTKAIIPVHFAGNPCEMNEILEIGEDKNIVIIEDAAHALGAEYKGNKIGSLKSKASCFSFYPVKHITTGEGGMLCTDDEKIAEKAMLLRAFGINKSTWKRTKTERPCYYEVNEIGFNYRMNEMAATIGLAQLGKLSYMNLVRAENAKRYANGLKDIKGVTNPETKNYVKHANLFYQIMVKDRARLIEQLRKKGIGVSVHYPVPVHQMPVYKRKYGPESLPNAEKISEQALSLPTHPSLEKEHVEYIIKTIRELI